MSRTGGDRGQAAVLIVGIAVVLLMVVAVVVDASAAFLHRQEVDSSGFACTCQGSGPRVEGTGAVRPFRQGTGPRVLLTSTVLSA